MTMIIPEHTLKWDDNVDILQKCSSLDALETIKIATSYAVEEENCIKMTIFPFQSNKGNIDTKSKNDGYQLFEVI